MNGFGLGIGMGWDGIGMRGWESSRLLEAIGKGNGDGEGNGDSNRNRNRNGEKDWDLEIATAIDK